MSHFFYSLGVKIYTFSIHLAALFSPKAKLWVNGRKNIWAKLKTSLNENTAPIIWMHAASLGEFEQGRPLLEKIRQQHPKYKILLTFFSPSGYEVRKNYKGADWIYYLPADSSKNAKQFLNIVQPKLAIFVKYEFWYHYLNNLHQLNIQTVLISAHFRANQVFFKWYGGLFRQILTYFEHIFVQNEASQKLLEPFALSSVIVAGDTRLDRVLEIKQAAKSFPIIEQFCGNAPTLVCGSSWPEDEAILQELINQQLLPKGWKIIIAPHNIDKGHIQQLESTLSSLNYSKYSSSPNINSAILIIDNIGMLSSLYRYATVAYIGGGFGAGIHNTLEAMVYEIPVFFGPKHQKFAEAIDLKKQGIGIAIENQAALLQKFEKLNNSVQLKQIASAAKNYIEANKGATQTILKTIF
ncbi:MAG: 3-deoxy-D-manno-octulosonic acid transferase [Aureispira sp.]|nr:3-deoxy-D-manno-octulosonic acid transferase [Aureispira sp.]